MSGLRPRTLRADYFVSENRFVGASPPRPPCGGIGASINGFAKLVTIWPLCFAAGGGEDLPRLAPRWPSGHLRRLGGAVALCSNPPRAALRVFPKLRLGPLLALQSIQFFQTEDFCVEKFVLIA